VDYPYSSCDGRDTMRPDGHLYMLHSCTAAFLILLCTVFLFNVLSPGNNWDSGVRKDEPERNERSTPRSFILPATPAVAAERENEQREAGNGVNPFECLRRLQVLGYEADDTPPILTARNSGAIFRFQKDRSIATTGRLDNETIALLGCQ
jgi:hypothetical protein